MISININSLKKSTLLFVTYVGIFSMVNVHAAEINPSTKVALDAFSIAVKDANARLISHKNTHEGLTLIQTSEDKHGNILQQTYASKNTPNIRQGSWKVIREDEDFSQSISVSDDIFFESTNLNINDVQLIGETNTTWVFRLPNMVNIESEDSTAQQEAMVVDESLAANLLTSIVISKQHPQIKALKIQAKTPFKPSLMVNIEKFEIRLDYEEAWPNGPIIRKHMTRHIMGEYGWLIEVNELITSKLSDIHPVLPTNTEYEEDAFANTIE